MAYHTHDDLPSERRRPGINWEYRLYFTAILLLIAIPIAVPRWTAAVIHPSGTVPNPSVMQRALSQTRIITTTIFSA